MLEVTFGSWCAHKISENALVVAHRFNYGDIVAKIPEYDDCVKAVDGETEIRGWYSNSPVELSGFYWFCKLLVDIGYEGKVYTEKSTKTREGKDWSLTDEDVCEVINDRYLLSCEEVKRNSVKWKKLCGENSEFRIVKDDELISDIPDANDGLTVSEKTVLEAMRDLHLTTCNAVPAAKIIGTAMGNCPRIACNDDVTFKVMEKLAGYAHPYVVIHRSKEDESCGCMNCECTFTDWGCSYVNA